MIATGKGWLVHSVDSLLDGVANLERYWLHDTEMAQSGRFRSELRRRTWIAGRIAAKQLLLARCNLAVRCPREIRIVSRQGDLGRPPVAEFESRCPSRNVSISHTARIVSASVSHSRDLRTGIDVVEVAEIDERRLTCWLTTSELDRCRERGVSVAEMWAAKEAAFKTLPFGVPFRPRQCTIGCEADGEFTINEGDVRYSGTVRTWRSRAVVIALAVRSLPGSRSGQQLETCC